MSVTESTAEEATLSWFESLGYSRRFGPDLAHDGSSPERSGYGEVVLAGRLQPAIERLNRHVPIEARDEACRKVLALSASTSLAANRFFHERMLTTGVEVEYPRGDGTTAGELVHLVDFKNPNANDWLVVNQFTVVEGSHNRRPDVVVFVNGLPLAVLELKNPIDEKADIWSAFRQFETYKVQIPSLFNFAEALVISDGVLARIGTMTADRERFMPWRTVEGDEDAPTSMAQLEVLIRGVFEKRRFLDLIRNFIVFEAAEDGSVAKKLAGYHQFHAVRKAVETTVEAAGKRGDRRCGVVWHTQGSGKSLTMVFYAGRIVQHPAMENPTLVVLTDRNDLDDQLFGTFSGCQGILRQAPVQAKDRDDLRAQLRRAAGGVVFTTIQKFVPESGGGAGVLSDRSNIVVIADEAHRSQYDFIDGYARRMRDALPNASFIGFTGTPVALSDRNTRAVFGDYISIYDIQKAVEDEATVRIYYESRLAKLELDERERPTIDPAFDEVTESEEMERKERLKSKWAALEAIVGAEKRIGLIARDLVEHLERRSEALEGKAMVVCMSRRICVELYDAIVKLRPDWHNPDDNKGRMKVIMTGNATDPVEWQQHVRNKSSRREMAKRFRRPEHPFKLAIVRDMWLTGFDVPCLHTMYMDKPMRGHSLMQAIARVNRVFKDKPGGLIVDYLWLADELRQAMTDYTESGGKGETTVDQEQAVQVMRLRYEVCLGLLHGFDWSKARSGTAAQQLAVIPAALDHIFNQESGKERFLKAVTELSQAFALAVPHTEAIQIRDDVSFFQELRAAMVKLTEVDRTPSEDLDHAIRQIVARAVASDRIVDIFSAAGLKKPEVSILSDAFLDEIRGMPRRNLAIELLRRLLLGEIKERSRKNLVQSRSFSEMLEKAVRGYHNRAIEAAQVIEHLIELAKQIREADKRGAALGLSEAERAFYDALEVNDSAVKVLGDETLRTIARELVQKVRANVSIDWTVKESVRAKLRVLVKVILRKYGYPPDKQESATATVLEQAELIAKDWVS